MPKGRLRWLRMPFRITPASEEYQRKQEEILKGLRGVETIHGNILVLGYRETRQEALENHDENLENLLKRCREKNLKLNKKKAKFRMTDVKFMGQILTADSLKPDEPNHQKYSNSEKCYRNSTISRMCKLSRKVFTKGIGHSKTST